MKILQVCAYAAPYEGNFMKSLYALAHSLSQSGHDTIYVFPETAKKVPWCRELASKSSVYYLPLSKARIHPVTYRRLSTIFRTHPDIGIVHSHFELYDLPLAITTPKHVKLFWHLHDAIGSKQKLSRQILSNIQYSFFSSRATLLSCADVYRDILISSGFPKDQAYTLLNGIDLNRIQKKTTNINEPYDFLAFVWNPHVKGLDVLLDACDLLLKRGYHYKILLIGSENVKKELDTRFPAGISEIVLQGPREDINSLYHSTKCFISSSRMETFSYSVCEAIYAGLPVISSQIPGLLWAKSLPTVFFFDNESSTMLANQMQHFLDSECTVDLAKITFAQHHIQEYYSIDNWVQKVRAFYDL